jgi:hypothetical protein
MQLLPDDGCFLPSEPLYYPSLYYLQYIQPQRNSPSNLVLVAYRDSGKWIRSGWRTGESSCVEIRHRPNIRHNTQTERPWTLQ